MRFLFNVVEIKDGLNMVKGRRGRGLRFLKPRTTDNRLFCVCDRTQPSRLDVREEGVGEV